MRKLLAVTMVGLGMAMGAETAHAQTLIPISVEGRAGAVFPTDDMGDALNTGWSVGADASLSVLPMLSIYGGYQYERFGEKEEFAGEDSDFNNSLIRVGGKLGVPLVGMATGFSPYVLGGAIFDKASSGGDESKWSAGYEAGIGASFRLVPMLDLTPEVRYQSAKLKLDEGEEGGHVKTISVSVGLKLHL